MLDSLVYASFQAINFQPTHRVNSRGFCLVNSFEGMHVKLNVMVDYPQFVTLPRMTTKLIDASVDKCLNINTVRKDEHKHFWKQWGGLIPDFLSCCCSHNRIYVCIYSMWIYCFFFFFDGCVDAQLEWLLTRCLINSMFRMSDETPRLLVFGIALPYPLFSWKWYHKQTRYRSLKNKIIKQLFLWEHKLACH